MGIFGSWTLPQFYQPQLGKWTGRGLYNFTIDEIGGVLEVADEDVIQVSVNNLDYAKIKANLIAEMILSLGFKKGRYNNQANVLDLNTKRIVNYNEVSDRKSAIGVKFISNLTGQILMPEYLWLEAKGQNLILKQYSRDNRSNIGTKIIEYRPNTTRFDELHAKDLKSRLKISGINPGRTFEDSWDNFSSINVIDARDEIIKALNQRDNNKLEFIRTSLKERSVTFGIRVPEVTHSLLPDVEETQIDVEKIDIEEQLKFKMETLQFITIENDEKEAFLKLMDLNEDVFAGSMSTVGDSVSLFRETKTFIDNPIYAAHPFWDNLIKVLIKELGTTRLTDLFHTSYSVNLGENYAFLHRLFNVSSRLQKPSVFNQPSKLILFDESEEVRLQKGKKEIEEDEVLEPVNENEVLKYSVQNDD
jgi:hypothetical protein